MATYWNKSLLITVLTLTTCAAILLYEYSVSQRIAHINTHWSSYNQQSSAASLRLSVIHSSFGYGGFIHNFKNFVLRQDLDKIPLIQTDLEHSYKALDHYAKLNLSQQERHALQQLRAIIDTYALRFQQAQNLIEQGASADIIDRQIRVDDKAALKALDYLAEYTVRRSNQEKKLFSNDIEELASFNQRISLLIPIFIIISLLLIAFLRKITMANQETELTRQYLDDTLNATSDTIININRDGIILHTNQQAVVLLGYSKEELLGANINILIPEAAHQQHGNWVKGFFDRFKTRPLGLINNLYILPKNSQPIPVEISLSYLKRDGQQQAIATIRDITERKEAEIAITQAQNEATKHRDILAHFSRVQTMNEMTTGIAHEINQPLAAIVSYSEACLRRIESNNASPAKLHEILSKIITQSDRASQVIQHLREMIKRQTTHFTTLPVNDLLEETVLLANLDAKQSLCTLELDLDAFSSDNQIKVDAIQIQQVLFNFIHNAIDAVRDLPTMEQRIITIRSRQLNSDSISISVCDRGEIIPDQDKLFEPFYTTKPSGLGIGLSICRSIIEFHNGTIQYLAQPEGGACFTFTLPLVAEKDNDNV